ncbi:hypothetical protein OH76DRAFT_795419 [Lentinus brumalis]|uniref:Uncharacterized protein n=1 Tax=Lentinus brumalis TaxID=2498619 RepID=A0A371D3L3_9APHY|nr:hypothetical protein OH76DRAFT_795419 [Polyporus brumalis]
MPVFGRMQLCQGHSILQLQPTGRRIRDEHCTTISRLTCAFMTTFRGEHESTVSTEEVKRRASYQRDRQKSVQKRDMGVEKQRPCATIDSVVPNDDDDDVRGPPWLCARAPAPPSARPRPRPHRRRPRHPTAPLRWPSRRMFLALALALNSIRSLCRFVTTVLLASQFSRSTYTLARPSPASSSYRQVSVVCEVTCTIPVFGRFVQLNAWWQLQRYVLSVLEETSYGSIACQCSFRPPWALPRYPSAVSVLSWTLHDKERTPELCSINRGVLR